MNENNKELIRNDNKKGVLREIIETILIFVIAVAIGTFIGKYLIFNHLNIVNGLSMYPTFDDGDLIIVDIINNENEIKRGDVITITTKDNSNIIKRVVGLPGEKVSIIDGKVYINDELLDEYYLPENTYTKINTQNIWILEENEYFYLGDNRAISKDSRIDGPITSEYIQAIEKTNVSKKYENFGKILSLFTK